VILIDQPLRSQNATSIVLSQNTIHDNDFLRTQNATLEQNSLRLQNATSIMLSQNAILDNDSLRSQNATSKEKGGRRYLPYVFTEQGVAMLSAVLRSDTAVKMSIQIISAFVAMRRFLSANAGVFQRLDNLEIKQLNKDNKVEQILNALESRQLQPKQGIFFDGQIFDAYKFACDLIRKAENSIILIDNYIDDTVLDILAKRKENVKAIVYTKTISKQFKLDIQKHNAQYPPLEIRIFGQSHDRFIKIDDTEVYHIGASLKDLGKKWFAFSKMNISVMNFLSKLSAK
jgi:hypothetical protein